MWNDLLERGQSKFVLNAMSPPSGRLRESSNKSDFSWNNPVFDFLTFSLRQWSLFTSHNLRNRNTSTCFCNNAMDLKALWCSKSGLLNLPPDLQCMPTATNQTPCAHAQFHSSHFTNLDYLWCFRLRWCKAILPETHLAHASALSNTNNHTIKSINIV